MILILLNILIIFIVDDYLFENVIVFKCEMFFIFVN